MSYQSQYDANFHYRPEKIKSEGVNNRYAELETLEHDAETIEWVEAKNLREILKQLVGQDIQLNKGTPERKQGTLLSIQHDHLTLLTHDKTVSYVNLHHVKSMNQLVQSDSNKDKEEDSSKDNQDNKDNREKDNENEKY